jgi:hypothetical protein
MICKKFILSEKYFPRSKSCSHQNSIAVLSHLWTGSIDAKLIVLIMESSTLKCYCKEECYNNVRLLKHAIDRGF